MLVAEVTGFSENGPPDSGIVDVVVPADSGMPAVVLAQAVTSPPRIAIAARVDDRLTEYLGILRLL
ncbi:hypothetical protein GCM10029964_111380 [Kibdelosporangium lantanae]